MIMAGMTMALRARRHGHAHMATARTGPRTPTDQNRVLIAACLTGGFMVAEAIGGC